MLSFLRPSGPKLGSISIADAIARQADGSLVVIDVRDVSELKSSGKAKGALHVPMVLLATKANPSHPEHLAALTPDVAVALYCASGARSGMAGRMLLDLGYTQVYNLGGLQHWRAGGGEVVSA